MGLRHARCGCLRVNLRRHGYGSRTGRTTQTPWRLPVSLRRASWRSTRSEHRAYDPTYQPPLVPCGSRSRVPALNRPGGRRCKSRPCAQHARRAESRFRYRSEVRADRDHTLCFERHRGEIIRAWARRFAEQAVPPRVHPTLDALVVVSGRPRPPHHHGRHRQAWAAVVQRGRACVKGVGGSRRIEPSV